MKKRVYIEIMILIFSNVIFYSLSNPVQKIVRNDFYTYGFLTVKSIVTVLIIILIVTMGVICAAILIFKRYKEIGLLSLYNTVTTIFWLVLLSATMDYSLRLEQIPYCRKNSNFIFLYTPFNIYGGNIDL